MLILVSDGRNGAPYSHEESDWDVDDNGRLWIFPAGLGPNGGPATWRHAAAQGNVTAIYNDRGWSRVTMREDN